ncbi:MAG: hypothetical protein CMO73_05460 [Verrucomicrobiales bacterium]|nr:hypothetical protein [Verrucomicrobiales bacterium]|tara:strand:- start:5241 stop:6155 length:915 start_codon:yes stop_codon:yes gene_type:complete
MNKYPYIPTAMNDLFREEKLRIDYLFLRPILLVVYFFIRIVIFPIKFLIHRRPLGFEGRSIDGLLAFGLKYLASHQAAELLIRHIQIEPLIYRFLLKNIKNNAEVQDADSAKEMYSKDDKETANNQKLNGIEGDFSVLSFKEMIANSMTIGHDELSYEVADRFEREAFLENLNELRKEKPEDHNKYSKKILEYNKKSSFQILGCTNVVMLIVIVITILGDLKTTVKALNSFGSDSVVLWAMKHIYCDNQEVLTDLDFYMQVYNNRSHYNSSVFFSDPSQYLYYHIVFHEFVYSTLLTKSPHAVS